MSVLTQTMRGNRDRARIAELEAKVARWRDEREARRPDHKDCQARLRAAQADLTWAHAEMRSMETARQIALTRARNLRAAERDNQDLKRRIVVCRDGTRVIFPTHPALVVSRIRRRKKP